MSKEILQRPYSNRVIDAGFDLRVKLLFGLRSAGLSFSNIEQMNLQDAEELYRKKVKSGTLVTRNLDNTEIRILKHCGISENDFNEIVNLTLPEYKPPQPVERVAPVAPVPKKEEEKVKQPSKILIINTMKKNLLVDALRRTLDKSVPMNVYQDYYTDVAREGLKAAKLDHLMSVGNVVPLLLDNAENRAALTVGSMGAENHTSVRLEDYAPIIPALGINLVTSMLTTKNLSVLSGDDSAWLAENAENEDGSGTISKISFTPSRISYTQPVSRTLILQGGPAFEQILIKLLMSGLTNSMLSTMFGNLARTATRPQGMGFALASGETSAAAAAVPGFVGTILAMEKALDTIPVGKRAFLTSTAGRRILKGTPKETGLPTYLMDDDNRVNGWPCYVSNAVSQAAGSDAAGALLLYGNWDELVLAQFGGSLLVEADPYSKAKSNQVMITVSGFFDYKSLRGTESTGTTDAYEFKGFSYAAIK